jgi:RNA polymerase sigma-70 factor (ECF subfamily)
MADAAQPPSQTTPSWANAAVPPDTAPPDIDNLVAQHSAVLYRYAYRLTGAAADAEDLTQQVFLTALQKLDQLREPAAARAWLFAVLRRAYLRQVRKFKLQTAANLDVDLLAIDLPDELLFDSADLQKAIDELPDDFKLVLVGFYFEQCSYKELAQRLELPIGTVMSRLSRAKAFLRTRLLAGEPAVPKQPHIHFEDSTNRDSHDRDSHSGGEPVASQPRPSKTP